MSTLTRVTLACVTLVIAGCASMFPELQAMRDAVALQGQIEEKYDQFRDERSWHLWAMTVYAVPPSTRSHGRELKLGVAATLYGPAHPEKPGHGFLRLIFVSSSESWWFLDSARTVDFILDGTQRLHLGRASHNGDIGYGFVVETMSVPITVEQLEQLATAEGAQGQLATTQFELTTAHLERFRAFVATLPAEFRAALTENAT